METLYFIEEPNGSKLSSLLRRDLKSHGMISTAAPIHERPGGAWGKAWTAERDRWMRKAAICVVLDEPTINSQWVTSDIAAAKRMEIPILGLRSNATRDQRRIEPDPILERYEIPIVSGTPEYLSGYLRGINSSFEYSANDGLLEEPGFKVSIASLSETLSLELQKNPKAVRDLSPRQFEQLVAELMEKSGYEVTLTQESRDNGVDIYAVKADSFGRFLTIVDCKKYREDRKIGIGVVRTMIGTLKIENASHAMLATTSGFTSVSKKFESEHQYLISLRDHSDIVSWSQENTDRTRRR